MTKPLAIVFYERLLPGSQVVNRLTDLGYRVSTTQSTLDILTLVRNAPPMLLVADLLLRSGDFTSIIRELKADPLTAHVPILGFCDPKNKFLADAAIKAGAALVTAEKGLLDQLPQLLEYVLAVD